MASWAYKLAVESAFVTADVVESAEFVDQREKCGVVHVPGVIVNDTSRYQGPWLAQAFLDYLVEIGQGLPVVES